MNSLASEYVELAYSESVVTDIFVDMLGDHLPAYSFKTESTRGHWEGGHYISSRLTGTWSKYGGGRMHIIQEEVGNTWVCQSCGQRQSKAMDPHAYQYPIGEYIRVCSICLNNDCSRLKERIR